MNKKISGILVALLLCAVSMTACTKDPDDGSVTGTDTRDSETSTTTQTNEASPNESDSAQTASDGETTAPDDMELETNAQGGIELPDMPLD